MNRCSIKLFKTIRFHGIVGLVKTVNPSMDVHLHGVGGFDTQTDSPEDILSIAELEGMEGVGRILLSIYPGPIPVMRRTIAAVKEAKQRQALALSAAESGGHSSLTSSSTSPPSLSALILGVHLEGPFLNSFQCGALDPRGFLVPSWYAYRQLVEGLEDTIRSITIAPELEGAPELIRQAVRSGVRVNMGHSNATFNEAEAGFRAGASGVVHIFNAMRPFNHREPGICGFALTNPEAYVEVIGDPHHLHLETIRLVFSMKPPDRILLVSDSVRGTGVLIKPIEGQRNGADEFPAVTDAGRLRGGSMSIAASSERLIRAGLDKEVVLKAITDNPHRYLDG